jgi:hypothetical protein
MVWGYQTDCHHPLSQYRKTILSWYINHVQKEQSNGPGQNKNVMVNPTTLPDDPLVQSAEDARRLTAKKNSALDSLGLSEEKTNKVETELRDIGWTEDLESRTLRQDLDYKIRDWWFEQDERALVCIIRHSKQATRRRKRNPFEHARAIRMESGRNGVVT